MLKHIRRELIFNKTNLYIFAGYIIVFWIWILWQDIPFRVSLLFLSFILPLFCAASFQAREDKFKAWTLNCSLPTSRKTIILARFILSWSFIFASWIFGLLFSAFFQKNPAFLSQLLELKFLFVFLLFSSLFLAFLLPFVIRFGITGVFIGLVVLQVLGVITLLLTSSSGNKDNILRTSIHTVINAVKFLVDHDPTPAYLLLLLVSVSVINFFTLKFSQFLFSRKDF
jgi:hypothetical protein